MNLQRIETLESMLENVKIPSIEPETNFWMIRSKGGYFYNEYINYGFIALGWNYIDKTTSFSNTNLQLLKEGIADRYGEKRPMLAINKCRRFIEEIKVGDYIIIPNDGSSEIAIGIAGEYYEIEELDYSKELVAIKRIDNRECEVDSISCPYKKRRQIKVLLRVSSKRIGHKLLRAISSYHGLSDMNEYAEDILNCVYNCYEYKSNLIYAVNIAKKEQLKLRELSKLFYNVTELFCNVIDEDYLSVTVNLNSPGKFVVTLQGGYEKIKKGAIPLLAIYLFVFGGSGFGFDFPGLAGGIINVIQEVRMMDIEVEKAEAELNGMQLDNYKKTLEIISVCNSDDIDMEKVLSDLERINELNSVLCFESNMEFAVVDAEQEVIGMAEVDEGNEPNTVK